MSVGSASFTSPSILDVGLAGVAEDNTFDRTDTTANAFSLGAPYWSAFWVWQAPVGGLLTLDASTTVGPGDLDAELVVYESASGSGGGFGSPAGSDNNSGTGLTPRLELPVTAGTWYLIQIGTNNIGGNGVDTYHLTGLLRGTPGITETPLFRTFTVEGGTAGPMGAEFADAPAVGPLSVSQPSWGTTTEAWWSFTPALDVPFAEINFDVMLSYVAWTGVGDETEPGVTLYLYDATGTTVLSSSSSGTDEFGRSVPRGSLTYSVQDSVTYKLQATANPGVRMVLRVSDYGPHTAWLDIPDQQWLSDIPTAGAGATDPVIWGPVDTPYIRLSPDPLSASFSAQDLRGPFHWLEFNGSRGLQKGFNYTQIPGTDTDALNCAWSFARQGGYSIGWWTEDGTGTSVGPKTPTCVAPPESSARDDGGGSDAEVPLGFSYDSSPLSGVVGGGTQTIVWHCYAQAYRAHLSDTLGLFGATAGADIDDVPYPDGYTNLYYENDVRTAPDLLSIDWAWEQTASSTTSGDVHPHMAARAVSWDNSDGSWDQGLAPDDTDPSWHGIDAAEGQLTDTGSLSAWVELDPAIVSAAMANEAAYVTDGATTTYGQEGGVLVVAYPQEQLSATRPGTISGLDTFVYDSYDHTYPRLRWNLAPTTRYRYLGPPVLPPATMVPVPISGTPGEPRQHFFNEWMPRP